MRLSDIRGERVFDVIADITEPACNIALDPNASVLFNRGDRPEGVTPKEHALLKVKQAMPSLMRDHKEDLITILAAIKDVGPDEYRDSVTMPTLLSDVFEMLTDEDLLAFLS